MRKESLVRAQTRYAQTKKGKAAHLQAQKKYIKKKVRLPRWAAGRKQLTLEEFYRICKERQINEDDLLIAICNLDIEITDMFNPT